MEKNTNPRLNRLFDTRSETYNHEMNWILDMQYINSFVFPVIPGGKLLDAGTGTGIIAQTCAENGWDVTAVDVNKKMLSHITGDIKKEIQNIERLSFPDRFFDVTVCRQALQYTNLKKALSSLVRVTSGELRLGHIHFISSEDSAFWSDFLNLKTPGRKNIFFQDDKAIETILSDSDRPVELTTESFRFNDILISHQMYPDDALYQKLMEKLASVDSDFISRNNIYTDENGTTYCDRYWNFIRCIFK